jgi:hypothetical protein
VNIPNLQPDPPDPRIDETRGFWRELGKTMVRESIATLDETARQVIAVAGILEGLYFHAVTFSDLRGQATSGALVVYLAPIVLLLISLCAGLLVFFPDRYRLNFESSEASKLVYQRTVASKLLLLRIASAFLALGVVAILFAVMAYLRR